MEPVNINKLNEQVISLKKQMDEIQRFICEDLEFVKGTEEAWQEIDEGKCRTMSKKDFLDEIEKW